MMKMMSMIRFCSLDWSSFHYSFISLENQPTPIGFNGNSAAGSLGGGSLSAPSFSQELLEPCVSILDVFEFLAVDDAICSGLRELGSSGFDVCEVITSFAMEQHGKVVNTKLQEQDHLQRLAVLSCSQLSLRFQL